MSALYCGFWTTEEINALRDARSNPSGRSQRSIAKHLYDNSFPGGPGHAVRFRSRQAIYGALRRLEDQIKRAVTQGVQAAEHAQAGCGHTNY